ncbi:hypothetical protein D049_1127B, partial [Vibrio parahaemolyticus VPTS-2010]
NTFCHKSLYKYPYFSPTSIVHEPYSG